MLERLLALLRGTPVPVNMPGDVKRPSAVPPSDFDRLLDQRLVHSLPNKTLLAGSLQLIGLDDVKRSLGGLWDRVAGQILRISQEEIGARLSERDVFRVHDGHTFLICFGASDERAAAQTTHEISIGIRERVAAEIPATAGRISVSAATASLRPEDFLSAVDISARLLTVLQRVRDDMKRTANEHRSKIIQNFSTHYFPAISPTKRRIVFNTCVASVALALPSLATFRAMAEPEQYQETLSRLDLTLLVSAVEALHLSSKQRGCCPLLVPVHLESLRESPDRDAFIKLLSAIPERYSRFLLLEITGATTAADCLDLLFIAPELQSRVKRLVLEVGLELVETLALSQVPIWGVSTSLHGRTSIEPELPTLLRRYVRWAAGAGLSTIGHGANSLGLALLAQKAGFHAIDGPGVYPSSSQPKPSFPVAPLDRGSAIVSAMQRRE
jgi:hypothetical protein